MLVSEESAIAQSDGAYSSLIVGMAEKGKLSTDTELIARVQKITNQLITQAVKYRPDSKNWKWSINVIDDPETVNAFCMAGGKMAIYTGLIKKLEPSDDEIAQVMGHEISHALASHSAEKMSVRLAAGVTVAAITASAKQKNRQTTYDVSSIAALTLITLPNSREAESEADKIGIELAAKAGYSPHAAIALWEKMIKVSGQTSKFDLLSTHPASPKRIKALSALENSMIPIYEAEKPNRNNTPHAWTTIASNTLKTNAALAPQGADKSPATSNTLAAQKLRELHSLKKDGVITESDFQKKKASLLEEF